MQLNVKLNVSHHTTYGLRNDAKLQHCRPPRETAEHEPYMMDQMHPQEQAVFFVFLPWRLQLLARIVAVQQQ